MYFLEPLLCTFYLTNTYKDQNNIGKTVIKDKYELPFIPA